MSEIKRGSRVRVVGNTGNVHHFKIGTEGAVLSVGAGVADVQATATDLVANQIIEVHEEVAQYVYLVDLEMIK